MNDILFQVKSQPTAASVTALNDLLPVMFQILSATRDTGLQSICSWEVGRLFAVHANQQQVESSGMCFLAFFLFFPLIKLQLLFIIL